MRSLRVPALSAPESTRDPGVRGDPRSQHGRGRHRCPREGDRRPALHIVNVIPYNAACAGYRPPAWTEVKAFTTALRRLNVPVKIRYSSGKNVGGGLRAAHGKPGLPGEGRWAHGLPSGDLLRTCGRPGAGLVGPVSQLDAPCANPCAARRSSRDATGSG